MRDVDADVNRDGEGADDADGDGEEVGDYEDDGLTGRAAVVSHTGL